MAEGFTREGTRKIIIFAVVGLVAVLVFYPFSPAYRESAKMKKAIANEALIRQKMTGHPRFEQVFVMATNYSDVGVGIEVFGRFYSMQDMEDLKGIVAETATSVPVWWSVSAPSDTWLRVEVDAASTNVLPKN